MRQQSAQSERCLWATRSCSARQWRTNASPQRGRKMLFCSPGQRKLPQAGSFGCWFPTNSTAAAAWHRRCIHHSTAVNAAAGTLQNHTQPSTALGSVQPSALSNLPFEAAHKQQTGWLAGVTLTSSCTGSAGCHALVIPCLSPIQECPRMRPCGVPGTCVGCRYLQVAGSRQATTQLQ